MLYYQAALQGLMRQQQRIQWCVAARIVFVEWYEPVM
jgi:hypothetical protein